MSISYQSVCNALEAYLAAMPLDLEVAYENATFEPTEGEAWMRVTHAPAPVEVIGMGLSGAEQVTGMMQLSLFYPRGDGRKDALDMADYLVGQFSKGTSLTADGQSLRIERAQRVPAVPDDDWYHVPVEVYWRAYDQI